MHSENGLQGRRFCARLISGTRNPNDERKTDADRGGPKVPISKSAYVGGTKPKICVFKANVLSELIISSHSG